MGQDQGLKMSISHLALDSSKSGVLVNVNGKFGSLKDCRILVLTLCFSAQTDMQSIVRKGFARIPRTREVGREGMIFI